MSCLALGFSFRKRRWLAQFLGQRVAAYRPGRTLSFGDRLYVWGDLAVPPQARAAELVRVEDGFIRSAGLGAAMAEPLSWAFDGGGLHHDSRQPSDLESRLQHQEVGADLLARAARLRQHIVLKGLTKYNVGSTGFEGWPAQATQGRARVLVVGQVPGDAALRSIQGPVRTNLGLLAQVRAMRPGAFIVYKRHPDVAQGLRRGDDALASRWADVVMEREGLQVLLDHVDEVHVMSSLAGFEALLRGKRVVCHANPFYAGWGLTEDCQPLVRRSRRRGLDELVAIALIDWPRYRLPGSGRPCQVEDVVSLLSRPGDPGVLARGRARIGSAWGRALRGREAAQRPAVAGLSADGPPEAWSGQDWRGRRVILLQGPLGPYFHRLARQLRAAGAARVDKLNFNGGDAFFYPGGQSYRGPMDGIPDVVRACAGAWGSTDVVLFGDCRPVHAGMRSLCALSGLRLWVFEEGYFRPAYITCEPEGVNGHSTLARAAHACPGSSQPPAPPAERVPVSWAYWAYWAMAGWAGLYYLACAVLRWRYPHYRHHRSLGIWSEALRWGVGLWRKLGYRLTERAVLPRLTGPLAGRYFLVPLQVHNDAQVTHHSGFDDVRQFIERVVASFSEHAPADHALVLKHHPMDRAYRDYGRLLARLQVRHGLDGRLWYVHDLDTHALLGHAAGTVVINSTVGLASVQRNLPTKVMGKSFYDAEGLTFQGRLEDFWRAASVFQVDADRYEAFRAWVLRHTQINDNFYAPMRPSADTSTPPGQ